LVPIIVLPLVAVCSVHPVGHVSRSKAITAHAGTVNPTISFHLAASRVSQVVAVIQVQPYTHTYTTQEASIHTNQVSSILFIKKLYKINVLIIKYP
jgi:hypothetical protein